MLTVRRRRECYPPLASLLAPAVLSLLHAAALAAPPTTSSRPAIPARFAPGVAIDWPRREVRVDATVVLRRGPLEFLACFPGKEHESIVRFDASAEHIYQALGLIGLTPGRAATQPGAAPAGDLLDIDVEWGDAGATRRTPAHEWLRGVEYGRPPTAVQFVFLGSSVLPDHTLTAGQTGEGVALVDFSDALIGVTRRGSSRSGELWVEANADRIPAADSKVVLIFSAARPVELAVRIDFRGVIHINDAPASAADVADLLTARRRLEPRFRLTIRVDDALSTDVARVRSALVANGAPVDAFEFGG